MFHYILLGLASGFIASMLAGMYGRDASSWFWICFICPPAIILLLIKGEDKEYFRQEELKKQQENEYTECPYCAELIKKKAKVCKHCGRDVIPKEVEL